jgi:hypothetical protein
MLPVAGYDVPSTTTRVATTSGGGRSDDTKNSYEPDRPVIVNVQSPFTAAAIERFAEAVNQFRA